MLTKLFPQAPPAPCVLVVLLFLGVLLSREASTNEALPVFLSDQQDFFAVELIGDDIEPGVYQFNDGLTLLDVIKLTDPGRVNSFEVESSGFQTLRSGERLQVVRKGRRIELLHQGWMPASHRLAMAIPLHPDRMTTSDWIVLPGIGPALAKRIEDDRQKNGDFGNLNTLTRVKGIGEKRIENWQKLFGER